MKTNALLAILSAAALVCLPSCTGTPQVADEIPAVIFDTDMGPDFDDVGALAVLHALADNGEAHILATVASNTHENVVPCIDVINHYFGRPELPVGTPAAGVCSADDWHEFRWSDSLPAKFPHRLRKTADAEDAVKLYRRIMASRPDNSVTVITVGFLTNLAALLRSPADEYSELSGQELVAKKAARLVSMAGAFPGGREFNVFSDAESSVYVFDNWPTPVLFSGFGIGEKILTGRRLIDDPDIRDSPVKEAYAIAMSQSDHDGRMSWDQSAVLAGVRGPGKYFGTARGRIIVFPDGSNTWEDDPRGPHEYLVWKIPADTVTLVIEDLMRRQPRK